MDIVSGRMKNHSFDSEYDFVFKNSGLVNARISLGFSEATAFANALGINYVRYMNYENIRCFPPPEIQRDIEKLCQSQGVPFNSKETFSPDLFRLGKILYAPYHEPDKMIFDLPLESHAESPEDALLRQSYEIRLFGFIEKSLDSLTPIESNILRRHYGFNGKPESIDEIAKSYNFSRQWVGQLEAKARKKLRLLRDKKHLKELYDEIGLF